MMAGGRRRNMKAKRPAPMVEPMRRRIDFWENWSAKMHEMEEPQSPSIRRSEKGKLDMMMRDRNPERMQNPREI